MKCELVRENLLLKLYGELADDVRAGVEQHLASCANCEQEWQSVQQFRADMDALPAMEPTPSMLTAARIRLEESLETAVQTKGWRRWVLDPVEWLRQMNFSPALASAILIVGFTAGVLTTFSTGRSPRLGSPTALPSSESSIAGISGITQDPSTHKVQINYDTTQTQSVSGSLDDPKIAQLLLYAARNQQNPGVRVESMDLLTQRCNDPRVREALIYALRYDKNPGVRLRAVDGLQPYVKEDLRVRDSVIEALLYDSNQGVRTEAIRMLQPVKADGSVRAAFRQLAQKDSNPYIKKESQRMLASVANID